MRLIVIGGISINCREDIRVSAVALKSLPQQLQNPGRCFTTSSTPVLLPALLLRALSGRPPPCLFSHAGFDSSLDGFHLWMVVYGYYCCSFYFLKSQFLFLNFLFYCLAFLL